MDKPAPPTAPAAPLHLTVGNPRDELAVREEATLRIALVVGLALLCGGALWSAFADPPLLLLLELFGVGAFSLGWAAWRWRRGFEPERPRRD